MSVPLYLAPAVRTGLAPYLRPGGALLTKRILELTTPPDNALIADAGCGNGAGLQILRQHGLTHLLGIDANPDLLAEAGRFDFNTVQADLTALPLQSGSLDLVVCECAWNLSSRKRSLTEFARVLRPGGLLALADIFLRCPARVDWPVVSCFRKAEGMQSVIDRVAAAGFRIIHTEDHSRLLTQTAAHFIFAHGSLAEFWQAVTGCKEGAKQMCQSTTTTRPGLFLLIGERLHG